ncbi:MAG TPA: PilC/PilY family type IV pilus protein, partial [Steroidobacter sp.]|nr:PilC/PilY family type IV pilus protein [Steroidobacter sp.]
WLEKARSDRNGLGGYFPDRRIPASGDANTLVTGATPANWQNFSIRIGTLGNEMRFTSGGDLAIRDRDVVAYNPNEALNADTVYKVSVRVKVCDTRLGVAALESNCVKYGSNYKPEGLIQKYSTRMRYSVFGYLNDGTSYDLDSAANSANNRDGGVLRARQKFVGEQKLDPASGNWVTNLNREWNPSTGVLVQNPDPADASATTIALGTRNGNRSITNSGVINYINKFGQLTTQNHKSYDPVSEMFYAAVRYLKNQGNVSSYSNLNGDSNETNYNYADGFPVITHWDDPMQYKCQNNAFLGIGDVYTHVDKNLPGNPGENRAGEPAIPPEVSSDNSINVKARTDQIAVMEGIEINTTGAFSGFGNSAYIAGLAYDAHTVDLRSDANMPGKQTASTYWVDVRENQILESRHRNQYWLAAKYGGFTVPDGFDPSTRTEALPEGWWTSDTELLSSGDRRPDNFYVASEADKMVESLRRAFASISEKMASGSSLGANAARIDTTTRVYQAQFFSGTWRGELQSYTIDTSNTSSRGSLIPSWVASSLIPGDWEGADDDDTNDRHIYVNGNGYQEFTWSNLTSAQRDALDSEIVVNYLRGDRTHEESREGGTLRTRTSVLGDIVNSTPVYVGKPNATLYANASFAGASSYADFAQARANRTPVVYVGANDGMLHGFDAETGVETYAFVPKASIANGMKELSDPGYQHRFFVDGEMAISDVYETASSSWKTVLVGTMGRGGPGVFALDVTDPANVRFLWEKTAADIASLGRNIGRPVIAQVANGDWRVIFGNGPDSSTGNTAEMVMIGALSGAVTVADSGETGAPNGLTAVLARDSNLDGFADVAYAGDLRGNLWKFTGLSGTPVATKIFQAIDPNNAAQPITAAPLVGKDPNTGVTWVFFGTGRYLNNDDIEDDQVQTWYGIKDERTQGGTPATRASLVQRAILTETRQSGLTVRTVEEGSVGDLVDQRGWYMDLISPTAAGAHGERMVVPNRFQGSALIGTTRIPETADACNPTGTGFIMAIDPFTGGRLASTFFDSSRDGRFNDDDLAGGDIISGIGLDTGVNNPNFIENEMYVSLDDGSTEHLKVQGGSSSAGRLSWRELVN